MATVGFARATATVEDQLLVWLAPATAVGAVARINYLIFPSLFGDYVYSGDLLRLLFYVLVTAGLVTEIRRYWGQLEERNRAVQAYADFQRDLVGTVSHELRTPLTSIRGYAELLAGDRDGAPDAPAAVIMRNVDRLESLIGDLLIVNEVQEGSLDLELAAVDLREVVDSVIQGVAPGANQRSVTLTTSSPDVPVIVAGDRRRLEQVVANLVSNAVKFAGEHGHVRVACATADDHAVLEVEDDGPGIPPDEHERVFERFYRSRNAALRAVPGTGLGLAIVRDLTTAHGGTVHVDAAPGGGARFTVRFPRRETGGGH